jgi:hypothetical protein
MPACTQQAYDALLAASWTRVEERESGLPRHNWAQTGFSNRWDAAKYCGDYADGYQHGYATAVCYTIRMPADALAGTVAKIVSLAIPAHGDRWLDDGCDIAITLSASATPPVWGAAPGDSVTGQLAVVPSNTGVDTSAIVTFDWSAAPKTASAYLHIALRLTDYLTHRGAWIEGGAMIDGAGITVTFDRDVSPDDPNPIPENGHVDSDHDGWSDLSEHLAGTDPHDSRGVPVTVLNLVCDYAGRIPSGQIVIHAFSNSDMNGVPDAVFHVPLEAWIVTGNARFQARLDTSAPAAGYLREGQTWFFAFLDADSTGVFNVDKPAAVATYGAQEISWGNNAIHFVFSDTPFGYLRHAWASTPAMGQYVKITFTVGASTTTVFEKVILGRNYIHEGDFLYLPATSPYYAQQAGLPMYDYDSVYAITMGEGGEAVTNSRSVSWWKQSTARVPVSILPENLQTVTTRDIVVRWMGDIRNSGWVIKLERRVGDIWTTVLMRYAYALAPYNASGFAGKYELCVNHSDSSRIDFTDGTYRWSVSAVINAVETAADEIAYRVGGGGIPADFSFSSDHTGQGVPSGFAGGHSVFGEYSVPAGGGGGGLVLSKYGERATPWWSKQDGTNGANGGGGGGQFKYHFSYADYVEYGTATSWSGQGSVTPPVVGGHNGGYPTVDSAYPSAPNYVTYGSAGAGGGGANGAGANNVSVTNGAAGGRGYHVVIGTVDSYFGCGGGGAGLTGGNGRKATVAGALTGQGGSGTGVGASFTTPGLDNYGDGGGGGWGAVVAGQTCGRGGTGVVIVNEHLLAGNNLVTIVNNNADKTTAKQGTYTPSEGCQTIDVLIVGGGGGGGKMAMYSTAVTAWGSHYAGGGGGGGGVLLVMGLSIRNSNIAVGYTIPLEFAVDMTDGEGVTGPYSISGSLTDNLATPEALTLMLYPKRSLVTDAAGLVREGFGGLPVAVQRVMSGDGTFTIKGISRGTYLLVARTNDAVPFHLVGDYWHCYGDGRPRPIEIDVNSVSGVDLVIGEA